MNLDVSVPARLGIFAATLAASLGVGLAVGAAVGPLDDDAVPPPHEVDHPQTGHSPAATVTP